MKSLKGLLFIIASFALTIFDLDEHFSPIHDSRTSFNKPISDFYPSHSSPPTRKLVSRFGEGLYYPQIHSLSLHHPTNLS